MKSTFKETCWLNLHETSCCLDRKSWLHFDKCQQAIHCLKKSLWAFIFFLSLLFIIWLPVISVLCIYFLYVGLIKLLCCFGVYSRYLKNGHGSNILCTELIWRRITLFRPFIWFLDSAPAHHVYIVRMATLMEVVNLPTLCSQWHGWLLINMLTPWVRDL